MVIDLNSPFVVAGFTLAGGVVAGTVGALVRNFTTKSSSSFRMFQVALDKKADKEDLDKLETSVKSFKTRIGQEIEALETNIAVVNKVVNRNQKCLIYLIQKGGDDPYEKGLME